MAKKINRAPFMRSLVEKFTMMGVGYSHAAVPKRFGFLSKSIRAIVDDNDKGRIHTPYYWARFVHDGRGRVTAKQGKFLVWFKDPFKDPRLNQGQGVGLYPERRTQLGKLTKKRFYFHLRRGDLVIARETKATTAHPFFSNDAGGGMFLFVEQANLEGSAMFSAEVRRIMGKDMNVKDSITLRL